MSRMEEVLSADFPVWWEVNIEKPLKERGVTDAAALEAYREIARVAWISARRGIVGSYKELVDQSKEIERKRAERITHASAGGGK